VDAALQDHISIGRAGQAFDKLLQLSDIDSVDAREELGAAGFTYIQALRKHMATQEKKLFPLAMAVLTRKDWQFIDDQVDAIEDPLFGEVLADDFQRLYGLITARAEAAGGTDIG
jgi:hemerythrin-like domain-containing protein